MPKSIPSLLLAWILGAHLAVAEPPVITDEVKASVRKRVDNGYTPGIVVCMVNADGRTCYSYGMISYDNPSTPNDTTFFELASVTKTFTTVLLAQMVEAGEVQLSDTAASLLPPGVNMPTNGGDAITLQQLATHTSGLPSTPDNLAATITDLANQFENYTPELMYEFLNSYTMVNAPGSNYEYSNFGVALLGQLLALSQGTDYETLLKQRLLVPMRMFDTAIDLGSFASLRTAHGHHGVIQRPPFEMNSLAPAGGLKSCAFDLGTYLEYNLGIQTGPISAGIALSHQLHYDLPTSYGYDQGLGWWRKPNGIIEHGGDSFGSTAYLGFRESTGTGVAALSNNRSHYPANITDIGIHCLDPSEDFAEIPTAPPISEESLRHLIGDYGALRFAMVRGRPVLEVVGQLSYTAYSDGMGGFKVLDIGLEIDIEFEIGPRTSEVIGMTVSQNGSPPQTLNRVRRNGHLSVAFDGQSELLQLTVEGEGDRDYPLECSRDLITWSPLGTLSL